MLGLKSFHIFFICASIVLSIAVTAWGFQQYRMLASTTGLATAIIFSASTGALVIYAIRYFGKLRQLD